MMRESIILRVCQDMVAQIKNYKGVRRKEGQLPNSWYLTYCFIILPIIWGEFGENGDVLCYYLLAVPIMLAILMKEYLPMSMPKIMYLCPMEAKERKRYLITAYFMKLLIVILTALITEGILVGIGSAMWQSVLGMIVAIIMMAVGEFMPGSNRIFAVSDKQDKALRARCHGYFGILGMQRGSGWFCLMGFYLAVRRGAEPVTEVGMWLITGIFVLTLLLTLLVLTNFKGMIEVMMNYEVAGMEEKAKQEQTGRSDE